jgi:acyl-CoA hydrolase
VPLRLDPDRAAARLRPVDTLGLPLGPGQPPAFLEALGRRRDWEDLQIGGALLTVLSDVFTHPGVRVRSGFFGPLERLVRSQGARIDFVPADFRLMGPILEAQPPRVLATAAAPPDADGWCSLSLHAGATVGPLHQAGADPERVLVVEVSARFPRTRGLPPHHPHALHVDEIDVLVESDAEPFAMEDAAPTEVDVAIARHVRDFVPDGATLQTGIGAVPSVVAGLLAEGDGGGYGVHSEMFTTGLMRLHRAGKVANDKGSYDGLSVCTFALGSRQLYEWLDDNDDVAFLPVDVVNAHDEIAANRGLISLNSALAVDVYGQVVADSIDGRQYSGIGGHEDFVAGAALQLDDRSLVCLPSTVEVDGVVRSRLTASFEPGTVITTPRHQVDVIVTEFGAAELQGRTVQERGEALAAIAHPDFREELMEAAARAASL